MDEHEELVSLYAGETIAAAEEVEEVAAEEVATESTDDAAAVSEETEEEAAADETEEVDESLDTDAADDETSDDTIGFQDLLEDIPSDETLKTVMNRIPQASKDAMVQLRDGWKADREILESLGGTDGAKVFQPVAEMLNKAEASTPDFQAGVKAMFEVNAPATVGMIAEAAEELLFNRESSPDARAVAKLGDAILTNRFGVTSTDIEKYALLQKGGFNVDEELEIWNNEGSRSTLFENQAKTISEQETKIQELTRLVENPDLITQGTNTNAVKDLDDEIAKRVAEGIVPFRDRVRWEQGSPLERLTLQALTAELKDSPEYKEAVKFVTKSGSLRAGDVIPQTVERLLYLITQKSKGRFGTEAVEINKQLRKLSDTSLNAKREKEVKETKPKSVAVSAPSHNAAASMYGQTLGEELAALYNGNR
jgi:hypothetical protein